MYTVRLGGPELLFFFGPVALWERRRHQNQWPHARPTVEECFRPAMVPQGRPSPRAWAGRTRLWVGLGASLAAVFTAEKQRCQRKSLPRPTGGVYVFLEKPRVGGIRHPKLWSVSGETFLLSLSTRSSRRIGEGSQVWGGGSWGDSMWTSASEKPLAPSSAGQLSAISRGVSRLGKFRPTSVGEHSGRE